MDKLDILGYFVIISMLLLCGYLYWDKTQFQLKCIVSTVDGNQYCVRDRSKLKLAANMLAKVTQNCKKLVEYMNEKHPDNEFVIRLHKRFNPQKVMEILPTSAYTAYSENKGEKVAFCLNKNKKDDSGNNNMIDEDTLTFVAIHELSHIGTSSIGHKSDFWQNFKFLLENAKDAGIHEPTDYKKKPEEYCGMRIRDNPYYDV